MMVMVMVIVLRVATQLSSVFGLGAGQNDFYVISWVMRQVTKRSCRNSIIICEVIKKLTNKSLPL